MANPDIGIGHGMANPDIGFNHKMVNPDIGISHGMANPDIGFSQCDTFPNLCCHMGFEPKRDVALRNAKCYAQIVERSEYGSRNND